MPKIQIRRGDLQEHDNLQRHNLDYNMNLWDFSSYYAVLTFNDQFIGDVKTFENFIVLPDAFPSDDNEATNKQYVDYAVTPTNLSNLGYLGDSSNQIARGDHSHDNLPTDDQKGALDTSQNPNTSNPFVVWDQFRLHGHRHIVLDPVPLATISDDGLLSSLDKRKLINTQFSHSMGELWTHDIGLTIVCASNVLDYDVKPLVDGHKTGGSYVDLSNVNGKIIIGGSGSGTYSVSLNVSFSASKVCTLHFHIIIDGVEQDKAAFERYVRNPGDIGSGSGGGMFTLSSGNELCATVNSSVNNTNVTINHFNFNIVRIHE